MRSNDAIKRVTSAMERDGAQRAREHARLITALPYNDGQRDRITICPRRCSCHAASYSSIANGAGSLHGTMVSVRMVLHRADALCTYTRVSRYNGGEEPLAGATGCFATRCLIPSCVHTNNAADGDLPVCILRTTQSGQRSDVRSLAALRCIGMGCFRRVAAYDPDRPALFPPALPYHIALRLARFLMRD